MYTCALNAAEGRLQIVLGHSNEHGEEHIVCAQDWHAPTRGTEILAPALQCMLKTLHLEPTHIQRFACVNGPGSFTGIRLVLSTVAAIRRITKAQNGSIDYMHALALSAMESTCLANNAHLWVLTHARRSLVHAQCFRLDSATGLPKALNPVNLISLDAMGEVLLQSKNKIFICGSGLQRNIDFFTPLISAHEYLEALYCQEVSNTALWKWAKHISYHTEDIEPLYIRPCDAVENLDSIAQKQGMAPEIAHARLEALLQSDGKIL